MKIYKTYSKLTRRLHFSSMFISVAFSSFAIAFLLKNRIILVLLHSLLYAECENIWNAVFCLVKVCLDLVCVIWISFVFKLFWSLFKFIFFWGPEGMYLENPRGLRGLILLQPEHRPWTWFVDDLTSWQLLWELIQVLEDKSPFWGRVPLCRLYKACGILFDIFLISVILWWTLKCNELLNLYCLTHKEFWPLLILNLSREPSSRCSRCLESGQN